MYLDRKMCVFVGLRKQIRTLNTFIVIVQPSFLATLYFFVAVQDRKASLQKKGMQNLVLQVIC